jgi:hypothetical protein
MADVINFNIDGFTDQEICNVVLADLKEDLNNLKDLYIFYKTKDNLINIIHTDVDFSDKCVMLQLLQHNINLELNDLAGEFQEVEPNI